MRAPVLFAVFVAVLMFMGISPMLMAVERLGQSRGLAARRQSPEKCFEGPRVRQPGELLPDAAPGNKFRQQCMSADVVDREIVQRFKKTPVVAAFTAPP
jgi:hypothetical protein